MYQHPELDAASLHPTSDLGRRVEEQQEEDAEDAALREVAQRAGLFFFFTSTCKFCQAQARVLKVFADTYGFAVLPISLDGRGLPEFPEVNADNGIARNLEVKMVPMLYLAIPDEQVLTPVGAGVLTLSDLKHRVLVLAGRKGPLVSSSPRPPAPKAP
jgi:conjugal transfer pilus assembly protein TraF